MIIGARAHDFGIGENLPFREVAELIKGCGYQSIQLAPAKAIREIPDIYGIEESHIKQLHEILEEVGLPVSVLGCYIEPSINDRELRLKNVAAFQRNIRFAKELKTNLVGTETTHFPMPDEQDRERAFANLTDSVKRMAEIAEKENVYIGVEPVAEHTMSTPELTRRLIDEVGSDKVKIIFDPSNLIAPQSVERQQEIFQAVYDLLGDKIAAVHVKDVVIENGKKRMVPLGRGVIEFPAVFGWLKQNQPDITLLRENSRRQWDSDDLAYIRKHW